jgi:renalase
MLGCYSLMLGFEQVQLFPFDAAMVHHADISWISVNSSKPNRPNHTTLLAHSTNLWAEANMDRDEEFVIQHLSQELRQAIGLDTSQAKCQVLQRWRYANIGKQPYQEGFIDVDQKLVACGDWCIQGRVESAFLVGENVANQIIREREL